MQRTRLSAVLLAAVFVPSLAACTDKTDADYRADLVLSVHDSIGEDLDALVQAAYNLQAASPSRTWKPLADAGAITEMRDAWKRARTAYEHVEGAIVALFPGTDVTLDARYEEMLVAHGTRDDMYPFDARGFTGMHAIERILYAPTVRPEVIAFERTLPGYEPPAYPASDNDAIAFKTVLVQRLIDDALELRKNWQPAAVDIGAAYQGLMGLMSEQREKVNLAVTGEEESRYANITLFDLRSNVDGTKKVYGLFRAWILSKAAAERPDSKVLQKLGELADVYATLPSDALPAPPVDWSAGEPTPENLATPFGALWKTVHDSVDPRSYGSVVFEMNKVATVLGLPEFVE